MKKNIFIPLIAASIFALTSCGAKAVSYDKFIEKASKVPEHSYVSAKVNITDTLYNEGKSFELKANYDQTTSSFVFEDNSLAFLPYQIKVNERAKDVVDIEKQEKTVYQENKVEYYAGSTFKVIFTRSGTSELSSPTTEQKLSCRKVYDKYGLLTSLYEEATVKVGDNEPSKNKTTITVSYSK